MLPGVIGVMMATEAIKYILGIGDPLIGRLVLYDALGMTYREMKINRDENCPLCGDNPVITELIDDYDAAAENPETFAPRLTNIRWKQSRGETNMLPCPDCNNPLIQFPIENNDVDMMSCDSCYGVWLVYPGDDLERVDNVTFDELVEAYGTEYPIDVDPSTVELPEPVEDALM